ncbi:MAG: ACT domain-containing protein, partial [Mogibacterium sp.]|nr:ACT domain-containing protein [Mogibacterium sp.]
LKEFEQRLHLDEINVIPDIAMIAVVGMGLVRNIGVAAKITKALSDAGINIRMLNQGTSEINVIIGVESQDFKKASRAIYEALTN